ncbi:MAG: hypothetical protein D4Q79_01845 [Spirochaetia bacterium]|nr:MAG: hypothetical protein D4Q79_01845 [Spirochaetia bacterium]
MIKENFMPEEKENWFKKYSTEIQALTTLALLGVTFYYACLTADIVNITREEFNISNRPYISIDGIEKKYDGDKLIIDFPVNNRGKIPARITNLDMKAEGFLGVIDNAEMILNPGEIKLKSNLIFEKERIQSNSFKFQVEINYYSLADQEEKNRYCIKYYFFLNSQKEEIIYEKVLSCE